MVYAATITKAGQVTIPKPVREAVGVDLGQRIIFNIKRGTVTIKREKDAAEVAKEIDALIPDEVRAQYMKKYAGMTAGEIREAWLKSDEAKQYYKERRERCL